MANILIVDDDEIIRQGMAALLNAHGYHTFEAEDGAKALTRLKQNHIDLVFLDIFMPNKDGFETIADIRRMSHDVKVIAMSGYHEDRFHPLDYARSLGADESLSKPFSAEELIAVLHKYLSESDGL